MFELRQYQHDISTQAAALLREYKIAYLALEVRCGKTLTSMAAAEKYGAKNVLFVTKLKAISSIQDDYNSLSPAFTIDIINHESLHKITRRDYDLIIVDEAHTCGGFPKMPERTKQLCEIAAELPVIFLSGTPSAESWSQLYHQFAISSFSPFKEWKNFYSLVKAGFVEKKIKYVYGREVMDYSKADKTRIDELTKHLFLTYSQEEAGFEQFVEEEVVYVQMTKGTYFLADKLRKNRVYIGKEGEEILADTAVKLMQKNHQIYSGSVICEDGNGIVFDNSKAKYIKEHYAGKKIAIFYIFKAEYLLIVATFGINRLTGDPDEFNNSPDLIFVSQIQSGAMGINLSTAWALIMFNIHYSSVLYWQSRARLQTKDRTTEAKVIWLFSVGGIEAEIYEVVKQKKDFTLSYFRKKFPFKELRYETFEVDGQVATKINDKVTLFADTKEELNKKVILLAYLDKDVIIVEGQQVS